MGKRSRCQSPAPRQNSSSLHQQKASTESKNCRAPTDSFPIFRSGDVYIKSRLTEPMQWQLHSAVLTRQSPWFASSLEQKQDQETESEFKSDSLRCFSYTIEEFGLVRQHIKDDVAPHKSLDDDTTASSVIKSEGNNESSSLSAASTTLSKPFTNATYNQVLGAFYSIPPSVCTTSITTATTQSEQLIEVARSLGCPLHLLAPHISITLLSYRQLLFSAIKANPVRWLLLSIDLQNDCIYTEALIHLAGAYPCWPWPLKRTLLPEEVRRLILVKSTELDQLCLETERELLLLTIQVHQGGPVQPNENSQFDTWFVVQTFRDILARELNILEHDMKNEKNLKRGTIFRKIRRGGSAYMDYEEMRRLLERIMPSAVDNLSEDLTMLKEHASRIVEELAVNELMLDVDSERVGYLTCVKVGKKDIPWHQKREA